MTDYADSIKSAVSCLDFAKHVGLSVNARGFCCCPFHGEKTPSLKLYKDGRGWYCFGCGVGGDVITFARMYWGTTFNETIKRLDTEFSVGLHVGDEIDNTSKVRFAVERAKRKLDEQRRKKEAVDAELEYWAAYDRVALIERVIEDEAPATRDADFSEAFVNAVSRREYAKYLLSVAEYRRASVYGNK